MLTELNTEVTKILTEVTGLYDSKSCQGEDYKFSLIIHNIPSIPIKTGFSNKDHRPIDFYRYDF